MRITEVRKELLKYINLDDLLFLCIGLDGAIVTTEFGNGTKMLFKN